MDLCFFLGWGDTALGGILIFHSCLSLHRGGISRSATYRGTHLGSIYGKSFFLFPIAPVCEELRRHRDCLKILEHIGHGFTYPRSQQTSSLKGP